ncbi:CHC2 zinc finger domain-containing protein [Verrucomicrobiales bacterium]|nr:CHC2 zinc finger domain-containing protein [bacterium]MDB4808625.1 CHC2 zinc finger domain-containing protein [Verrucomicrobiales bacterium]
MIRYNFQEIRERNPLPEYLMDRGVQLRRQGGWWVGKCPIHQEQNGYSFTVSEQSQKAWCRGACSTEDGGWDVVDCEERLGGGSRHDALQRLNAGKIDAGTVIRPRPKRKPDPIIPLTAEQEALKVRASMRLYKDRALQQWLADNRGWKRETIEALAVEHALGWIDEWTFTSKRQDGTDYTYKVKNLVAFGYEHGIKVRYHRTHHPLESAKEHKDGRRIQWLFGKPTALWRSQLDAMKRVETVIITEGETDAIRWLDLGECQNAGNLVLAAPSASTFKPEWAKALTGKKVRIAPDFDPAGQKASRKIAAAVHPYATKTTCYEIKS